MNNSGVYLIINMVTGLIYVGSSNNINIRWIHHRKDLNKNKHFNSYLQNSWNKYGKECFEFIFLEKVSLKNLRKKEQYWLDFFKSYKRTNGYNIQEIATGGPVKKFFKCKIKNCLDKYLASGYCNKHYRRFKRNGSASIKFLKSIRRYQKTCKICKNKHDSHGYCQKHAYYYRTYGRVTRCK